MVVLTCNLKKLIGCHFLWCFLLLLGDPGSHPLEGLLAVFTLNQSYESLNKSMQVFLYRYIYLFIAILMPIPGREVSSREDGRAEGNRRLASYHLIEECKMVVLSFPQCHCYGWSRSPKSTFCYGRSWMVSTKNSGVQYIASNFNNQKNK